MRPSPGGRRLLLGSLAIVLLAACSRHAPPPPGAFEAGADFEPLPPPGPLDWRAQFREPAQSFEQFVRSKRNRPDRRRNKIYLQPLGEFPAGGWASFSKLKEATESFFQMDVVVRPPLYLDRESLTRRRAVFGEQILTGDLLDLLARRLPRDAFAMLGFTMRDIYPGPQWSFVFGQASLNRRVGVYSFARYDPRFYGETRRPDWQKTALWRSCKVLTHETSHMFGIHHCLAYRCVMNGSNSMEETDASPFDLCPVDLHKLHASLGFDVMKRYEELRDFTAREGFEEDAAWFRRRIEHLRR